MNFWFELILNLRLSSTNFKRTKLEQTKARLICSPNCDQRFSWAWTFWPPRFHKHRSITPPPHRSSSSGVTNMAANEPANVAYVALATWRSNDCKVLISLLALLLFIWLLRSEPSLCLCCWSAHSTIHRVFWRTFFSLLRKSIALMLLYENTSVWCKDIGPIFSRWSMVRWSLWGLGCLVWALEGSSTVYEPARVLRHGQSDGDRPVFPSLAAVMGALTTAPFVVLLFS